MSKLLPFWLVLLSGLSAIAEPLATDLTPERAVAIALTENRDLAAARFAIQQAEGRLKQSGLWPNPEFELGRSREPSLGFGGEQRFTTGFKQRFPIAGRLTKAKAIARVDVAMAMAELRNQERLLAGETLARSREWLVLQEQFKANQEIQDVISKIIEVSEKRLKLAEVSEADVNLAKLELQKISLAHKTLLAQQDVVSVALNRLLGREPSAPLRIVGELNANLDPKTFAGAIGTAIANRPEPQNGKPTKPLKHGHDSDTYYTLAG